MKIIINETSYTAIDKSLNFAPCVDVTGSSLSVDEFSADIHTTDEVEIGQTAELRDARNYLWAKYWLVSADRVDADTLHVVAQSPLILMQDTPLPAVMYDGDAIPDVIEDIILSLYSSVGSGNYTLDSSFNAVTLSGFCPEQTPRERLQWVCLAIGAYVRTCFSSKIEILPINQQITEIPTNRIYWRPKISYSDVVTAITGTAFAFAEGDPEITDEWVEDGNGVTYIVTRTDVKLTNTNAPSGARENVVEINKDMYLLSSVSATPVLTYLSGFYFDRATVTLEAINNDDWLPGDYVYYVSDDGTAMAGYIQSCDFSFGKQAKARMTIIGGAVLPCGKLVIKHRYGDKIIAKYRLSIPVGLQYEVVNQWHDISDDTTRRILMPETEKTTGTMTSGTTQVTVDYEDALILDLATHELTLLNVDEITTETEDELTVGVIS